MRRGRDPGDRDVVELVRLCGVSGAARITGLQPDQVQAGYELQTGDVLPRVAHMDEEVLDGCMALWEWAEKAGATPTDFVREIGKCLRLPPAEAERLWRATQSETRHERRTSDSLKRAANRILNGSR